MSSWASSSRTPSPDILLAPPPSPEIPITLPPSPIACLDQPETKETTVRFLDVLIFDCRFIVYHQLVKEALNFKLSRNPNPRYESPLFALARTCRSLRDEIQYFLKLNPDLVCAPGLGVGLHDPSLVTWRLRPTPEYCFRRHFPKVLSSIDIACLQNFTIHERSDCRRPENLTIFEHLACMAFTSRQLTHVRNVEVVFVNPKLTDSAMDMMTTLLRIWEHFWCTGRTCHPKLVCSCCSVLPSLSWRSLTDPRSGKPSSSTGGTIPISWDALVALKFKLALRGKSKNFKARVLEGASFIDSWYGKSCSGVAQ